MATNSVQPGSAPLRVTLAAAATSGVPFLVGEFLGVPGTDGAIGETIAVEIDGVWSLPKVNAGAGQAWATVGAKVYWDDTAKLCTTTAGANKLIGHVAATAGATVTTGQVRLMANVVV